VVRYLALVVAALGFVQQGYAAELDPVCRQYAADLSAIYDAASGVRFCPPVVDEEGRPLPDNAIVRCVTAFGETEVEVASPAPGSVITIPTPASAVWGGVLSVWCETAAGAGEAVSVDARFPAARPGRPHLLP